MTDSMDMSLNLLHEIVKDRKAWHAAVHVKMQRVGHDLATEHTYIQLRPPDFLSFRHDALGTCSSRREERRQREGDGSKSGGKANLVFVYPAHTWG